MEPLLSAIASDLLGRALSVIIQRYGQFKAEATEHKLQRLHRLLLRIEATVEEAEGRYITNQAMLRQLEMLRQRMYGGHYMLDTIRSGGRAVALPRFSPAKLFSPFPVSSNTGNTRNLTIDGETVKNLEKMLDSLDTLMSDMKEFIVFLEGYPRIGRQPYSTYLIIDRVMFGRQMEKEAIINFLLRSETSGCGNLGVLPVVGPARVGKSTLVEHVCLDERVRGNFSSIVVFAGGDLCAGNLAALRNRGVMAASHGRSIVVIELDGDMDDETWGRLYYSAASIMGNGSKIIVMSRSEKIAAFGTAGQALRLQFLTEEPYWYFFKALAFGSANPEDHPKLASMGMEIAVLMKGSFLAANIVGSMLRANLNSKFWSRVLKCMKEFTSKHLLVYGEHPQDLLGRDHPIHIWRMARTQHAITICKIFQMTSPQNCVPELPTAQDIVKGRATDQGDFCMLSWRATIPPYNTYLARCVSQKIRCSIGNRKRPRQALI